MTGEKFGYDTPAAFRAALKGHFGQIARTDRRYPLHELQRQFAYDRALARLFSSDDADRWVLKGAGALLARLPTARHSKDIDVLFDVSDAKIDEAVESLLIVLRIDLGDHFLFDVTRIASLQEEAKGARVHVNARLGPTLFAAFHIDVVVAGVMTGRPDLATPLTPLVIEGLIRPRYRVFPVADHLADKLCAAVGSYARVPEPVASTRVKDLVDIAVIATSQTVAAADLTLAVRVNAATRRLHLPERFAIPDPIGWSRRYPRVASQAPGLVPDYETAVTLASHLFDPVLGARASGAWDPVARVWCPARTEALRKLRARVSGGTDHG